MTTLGAQLIMSERFQQIKVEGWTKEHDDEHRDSALALAAVCYATPIRLYGRLEAPDGPIYYDPWPLSWDNTWDKRRKYGIRFEIDPIPDPASYSLDERLDLLIKAGALIAAEIDRIKRLVDKP
jgi:hypothetical protein